MGTPIRLASSAQVTGPTTVVHDHPVDVLRGGHAGSSPGGRRRPAGRRYGSVGSERHRGNHPVRASESPALGPRPVRRPCATCTATTSPGRHLRLVAKYRHTVRDPFGTERATWVASLPKASFGSGQEWLGPRVPVGRLSPALSDGVRRGLWRAHDHAGRLLPVRRGREPGNPQLAAVRSPNDLHGPGPGPQILVYSGPVPTRGEQLQLPYGSTGLCKAYNLGKSDDLDFWCIWAAAKYGLATRDMNFFDATRSASTGHSSVGQATGQHVKLAFAHQQSLLGPHGEFDALSIGDWSDLLSHVLGHDRVGSRRGPERLCLPAAGRARRPAGRPCLRQQSYGRAANRLLSVLRGQWTGQRVVRAWLCEQPTARLGSHGSSLSPGRSWPERRAPVRRPRSSPTSADISTGSARPRSSMARTASARL